MDITTIMALFAAATNANHLPVGLINAVCKVESHYDTSAINLDDGSDNSLGLCQVQLRTAVSIGFKGTAVQLMDPTTNIQYASLYLRIQLNRYHNNIPKALAAYNAGTCKYNSKGLISNRQYVEKVLYAWETQ